MPIAASKKCSPYNFRFIQDDPLKVVRILWPDLRLSVEQEEIMYSVWFNRETYVKAANQMGKDFIGGLICLVYFLTRQPCRVVTTSASDKHLKVLWSEINSFVQMAKYPLTVERGGPLICLEDIMYKIDPKHKEKCAKSYIMKQVASPNNMDAMGGHHIAWTNDRIPRTMWVADEASDVKTEYHQRVRVWAHRKFVFGNAWECDNPFRWAFKGRPGTEDRGGDVLSDDGKTYFRKCFSLPASSSPNVRFAQAQIASGKQPTDEIIIPGIKPYGEYVQDLRTMDPQQRSISLDAEWYTGKEIKLFPQEWLDRAQIIGQQLRGSARKAKAMGVDPAEGGDKTCFCIIDEYGIIELVSLPTPDTTLITDMTIDLIKRYSLIPGKVFFDTGGGGKQHVDRLAKQGLRVHGVAFGESVVLEPKRSKRMFDERVDVKEDKGAYMNRRAMMYGEASILLDPMKPLDNPQEDEGITVKGVQMFGIPPDGPQYGELVRQLACMPKKYVEGKLYLPPKSKRGEGNSGEKTLTELLGRSPDEADAFVLAVYAMTGKRTPFVIKGFS